MSLSSFFLRCVECFLFWGAAVSVSEGADERPKPLMMPRAAESNARPLHPRHFQPARAAEGGLRASEGSIHAAEEGSTRYPQHPLSACVADVGIVFIGGLGDEISGIVAELRSRSPSFLRIGETRELRAYYHWHAGNPGMTLEAASRAIAEDIAAFRRRNPGADVILIGHSLGASTAWRTALLLTPPSQPSSGKVYLLTLDPVDRSIRPSRPETVAWWGNGYVAHSASLRDFIAVWGGRWGACPGADMNLCFDGRNRDEEGQPYIHDHAAALLLSRGGRSSSLLEGLQQARQR